jgi:UDP-GlcNAc:undecaprenyl-phosphate GlcNAc-1-phosphate transferase
VVRRTWKGQSPFAADRGHLHHRLLEIGHSHARAVWIMYFWAALIAFAAVAFSVNSSSLWIVMVIVGLSALGLVALLLPAFTPHAPRWAESVVPPRYRRRRRRLAAAAAAAELEMHSADRPALNGSTAIGDRAPLPERRRTVDSRR